MSNNKQPLRFLSDDGSQAVRVHETMEFAAAVLDDENAFTQMIVGELLKALRQGKNVLVIAPAIEFDSFGLPISRIRITLPNGAKLEFGKGSLWKVIKPMIAPELIEDLEFITVRAAKVLASADITRVDQLLTLTETDLLALPGFSKNNLMEVREALHEFAGHCEGCRREYPKTPPGEHIWPSGIGGGDYRECTATHAQSRGSGGER